MFEHRTYENLLQEALDKVSSNIDKRQGSIIYDAIAPICAELAQAYIDLNIAINEGFADTCSREYLIKRAKERGIDIIPSTKSIILAEMIGDFSLQAGQKFNCDDLNFVYTGENEGSFYKLECETPGTVGNISYGTLLPIDSIPGLQTAEIVGISFFARDDEDTEVFRKRYFESFQTQAFGGNKADYLEKINNLNKNNEITAKGGIGGCKVYRVSEPLGNVKITVMNSGYDVPSEELIQAIKQQVDPIELTGEGQGVAPIGHSVIIEPIQKENVTVTADLTLREGYSLQDVLAYINQAIDNYLLDIRKSWASLDDSLVVRISYLESAILEIDGILDITNTKLNGLDTNLTLQPNFLPFRLEGEFNV